MGLRPAVIERRYQVHEQHRRGKEIVPMRKGMLLWCNAARSRIGVPIIAHDQIEWILPNQNGGVLSRARC